MSVTPSTLERTCTITFRGHQLQLDPSGALFWPDENLLIVSDLHLEKGSFLAQFGSLIPRYDTRDTLLRLSQLIERYQPNQVVCLGDSFHDTKAMSRLQPNDRDTLLAMMASIPGWHWILGNHDAVMEVALPGVAVTHLDVRGILLLHEPEERLEAQIIGHFHPKIKLSLKGGSVSGKVFVQDEMRLFMPSFGSYTGGLDVRHEAIASQLRAPRYYMLYRDQVWKV